MHSDPSRRFILLRNRQLSMVLDGRLLFVTLALVVAAALLGLYAITLGRLSIPVHDVLSILAGRGSGGMKGEIVFNLRLPRVLTGFFVGWALGASGAVFQSLSRNMLASPDVIGFTTGAAAGALVQIVMLGGGSTAIAVSAVCGGLLTAALVYLLSFRHGRGGGYRLILIGIGMGATLTAVNGFMLVRGDLDNAVAANLWLSGSLDGRKWSDVLPVMAGSILLVPLISVYARRLALMEMGDDLARQLGVPVERTRMGMIAAAVLLAGLATAAAGPVSFVALAAPQLVLRLTRGKGVPVLSAAAMGAFLLVLADLLTQSLTSTLILPIGRMTGLVGGVYLLWLLTRAR
ncbi:FecCD family ABC transporter permease [Allorhizobium undicola]|uniref:FecCD family ABC transporter permease n=1 Tax=Allorhizobium undicola TaxID=78527 RepID=UPI0004831CFC|nr:iron chelate uptake ABC transporter family permease subunit [Allorhizobium undicola]